MTSALLIPLAPLRSLTALFLAVGCVLSFSLARGWAAPAPVLLTTESLKPAAVQYKLTPDQVKILQTDIDLVMAAEQKVAEFQKSLTPALAKKKDNLLKLDGLQREVDRAKGRLAADQKKLLVVPKK